MTLGCALLVAGCGGGADAPAGKRTAGPRAATPTATAASARIAITQPRAGATVSSAAPVAITGRSTPGATVLLSAGCSQKGCHAIARADGSGRWGGRLVVAGRRAELEASTPSADVVDTVKVRIAEPPPSRRRSRNPRLPESEPTTAPRPAIKRVVVVGDSLAVGTQGLLQGLLPHFSITTNALTGRPLAAGMKIIGSLGLRSPPTALAVSLFTNDDPRNVAALEAAVRRSVAAVGPAGCAVWATIVRPPVGGVGYRAANDRLAALEAELPNLVIVPWAEQVAAQPALIGPDHVHGTPAGYRARAALYASAVQSCG